VEFGAGEADSRQRPLPAPLDRWRNPFVGRRKELSLLLRRSERLQVVIVRGESGIGKTRLAAEAARSLHVGGALVLYGRCDEGFAAPYRPWAEALSGVDEHWLAEAAGGGAAALARVLPTLHVRPSDVVDVETARIVLLHAFERTVAALHRRQPLVVVLDDVQWIDVSSVVVLRHITHALRASHIRLILTARDSELATDHPLRDLLAALITEDSLDRVHLAPFDEASTAELIAVRRKGADSAVVWSRTGGNPFFVEQLLTEVDGTDTTALPAGVRSVVQRRVDRLSQASQQALTVAAVAGLESDLDVLDAAIGVSLVDALDEAVAGGLIEEVESGRIAFPHALMRDTLLADLSATRRVKLHWQIADALSQWRPTELGAIAYHRTEGVAAGDASAAVDACLAAGSAALDAAAFDEAVAHFDDALEVLTERLPVDDARRYRALMGAGTGSRARFGRAGTAHLREAAEIASRNRWSTRFATAVFEYLQAQLRPADVQADEALLQSALGGLPTGPSSLRAMLLAVQARRTSLAAGSAQAEAQAQQAEAMALQLGGRAEVSQASLAQMVALIGSPRAKELAERAERFMQDLYRPGDWSAADITLAIARLQLGDRPGFDTACNDIARRAAEYHSPRLLVPDYAMRALRAMLDGDFDLITTNANLAAAEVAEVPSASMFLLGVMAAEMRERGQLEELIQLGEAFLADVDSASELWAVAGSTYCELGRRHEARSVFDEIVRSDFRCLRWGLGRGGGARPIAELCVMLDDFDAAAAVEPLLRAYQGQILVYSYGTWSDGAADRAIAQVLAAQGRVEEAAGFYESALALERAINSPPLAARTQYWYARLLLETGTQLNLQQAAVLLSDCVATSGTLGMTRLHADAQALAASAEDHK
jgi:tetratricopeptide (TPR) repeat protein/anti-anti-sigma regulatory factor